MLHLILGRAGCGKTEYAMKTAGEAAQKGIDTVIIVPEQFTFETERRTIRDFGEKSCLNVETLSFSRLVHRVFSIEGGLACHYIDDCGRNVLMKLALSQIGDMLEVYSKQAKNPSFVKTMVTAVGEYKICGITPDMLELTAKKYTKGLLSKKLLDIALIMRTYCANLDRNFADPLDDLTRLANKLKTSHFFDKKTVVIDGFKGFTVQEKLVLAEIFKSCGEIYITLCAEKTGGNGSSGLFSPVEKTAGQLVALANKCGVAVASPVKLTEPHRFNNETLKYFEKSIFRPDAAPYPKEAPEITITSLANTYDEAEYVASTCAKLVRTKNCRYGDIAVISRGIDSFDGIIDTVFSRYDIPLFYDSRSGIADHPLMALVLSVLSIITENFRRDTVLRYLKTGLAGFSTLEVSMVENYLLMWNIRGEEQWQNEWTQSPNGFEEINKDETKEELANLNTLRERIYSPIAKLRAELDKGGKAAALYSFLCSTGVREAVNEACRAFRETGENRLSDEYAQIWQKLVMMLDQIELAARGTDLSTADFASMLSLVIENTDLGSIPPSLDAVTAGDAERIRTGGVKYVFVIGLVEGVFPRGASTGGLIKDSERRALIDIGLELSPPAAEQAADERFFAYNAFSCACDGVYLTAARADTAEKELRPSYFLAAVKRLIPKCNIVDNPLSDPLDTVVNEKTAFDLLASNYSKPSPLKNALSAVFDKDGEYAAKIEALGRSFEGRRLLFKNPRTAKTLYGTNLRLSPSRIETFNQCKFSYFCKYGIGAKPRRTADLDAPQIGSVIHFVLQNLLKRTEKQGLENTSPEELSKITDELLREYAKKNLGGLENKPERFRYIFSNLADTVNTMALHMVREFRKSGFRPADYELDISDNGDFPPVRIKLPDGGVLTVVGKIDRVDTMTKEGTTYLRVIDYKTGTKKFNLSQLVYGLNLQMFIYLFTLWSKNDNRYCDPEKLMPAGVLYVPAKKPEISVPRNTDETVIQKKSDSALKMSGLILKNETVIKGMESGANGVFVPASGKDVVDKDGTPTFEISSKSDVATLEEFGKLKEHVDKLLIEMTETLKSGDAAAVPVDGLDYNPCSYCSFSGVCGIESGSKRKVLHDFEDEVFDHIKGGDDDGDSTVD